VRSTILLAFKALPLLLISFIGFIAVGLGNLSLFLLFIGHATIVPLITELSHYGTAKYGQLSVPNDISQLVPLSPTSGTSYNTPVNVMPTYWMANLAFFFGYLLMNAIEIYRLPAAPQAADWMIISRKTRAATLIASSLVLLFTFSAIRYSLTGTETLGGIAFAIVVLGGSGMAWYQLATNVLGARNSDIFGVVQQMVSQNTGDTKPVTCVYKPSP
jgi:hypothetical protein